MLDEAESSSEEAAEVNFRNWSLKPEWRFIGLLAGYEMQLSNTLSRSASKRSAALFSPTGHCVAPLSGMDRNIIMDGKAGRPDLGARMCWRPLFMRIKKIGESA
jgi:hypothetical protein